GSGTQVSEINKLIKQHRQMAAMMKKMARGGGISAALGGLMGGKIPPGMGAGMGAGMPDLSSMDPAELERMAKQMGMDPAELPAPPSSGAAGIADKLPADFSSLAGTQPAPGKPQFPSLPGLGRGPTRKK
ncbi:MAG TPA: hypothetical protein ENJ68_02095, partial [Devosia sp.]|nr:hypothetical protein [Devosia sp.]